MQLLIRTALFCFVVIYFFNIVYAGELGVSPANLEFEVNSTFECKEIRVFSTVKSELKIEDYWSLKNSRNLEDYKNKSEDFGVNFYVDDLNYDSQGIVKACASAKNDGDYYGVLLFSYPDRKVGVGVWMVVKSRNGWINLKWLDIGEDLGLEFVLIENTFLSAAVLALLLIYVKELDKKPHLLRRGSSLSIQSTSAFSNHGY